MIKLNYVTNPTCPMTLSNVNIVLNKQEAES